jgi:four helix bundle protein
MGGRIRSHRDLLTFDRAISLATSIFEATKRFPREERYSLTDQIRRSSRSVCANVGEAFRKRRYETAFINRLNLAEAEANETQIWVEIAERCGYLTDIEAARLDQECDRLIAQIVHMIKNPQDWVIKKS